MVGGDQGAEPLHASPGGPVDQVLLDLQQSVEGELQHLAKARGGRRQMSGHHRGPRMQKLFILKKNDVHGLSL